MKRVRVTLALACWMTGQVFPGWIDQNATSYKALTYRGFEALTADTLRDLRADKDDQFQHLCAKDSKLRVRVDALEHAAQQLLAQSNGGS